MDHEERCDPSPVEVFRLFGYVRASATYMFIIAFCIDAVASHKVSAAVVGVEKRRSARPRRLSIMLKVNYLQEALHGCCMI